MRRRVREVMTRECVTVDEVSIWRGHSGLSGLLLPGGGASAFRGPAAVDSGRLVSVIGRLPADEARVACHWLQQGSWWGWLVPACERLCRRWHWRAR
jgi:hypothetical protein